MQRKELGGRTGRLGRLLINLIEYSNKRLNPVATRTIFHLLPTFEEFHSPSLPLKTAILLILYFRILPLRVFYRRKTTFLSPFLFR